ncbi:Pleckstrin y domain-containing H member 2 [Balamuthia mandrillaris]
MSCRYAEKEVFKQGWMTKKGNHVKNWKRRFFVLSKKELKYFVNDMAFKAKGVVLIKEVKAVQLSTDARAPNFSFELVTPSRTYVFSCESQQDVESWMEQLEARRNALAANSSAHF